MFNSPCELYVFIQGFQEELSCIAARPDLAGSKLFKNYQDFLKICLSFEAPHLDLIHRATSSVKKTVLGVKLGLSAKNKIDTAWHDFFFF